MAASYNISIKKEREFPEALFTVTVVNGARTAHRVTLSKNYYEKLANKRITPEIFIERSFQFLLKREPNTAILAEFDLPLIGHYFPEYEKTMQKEGTEQA